MTFALGAKQSKASRDGWNLEVPERASGVPTKYDLVLHRSNGCFTDTRARLEIQVRNGRARWELCELSGIYRTDLPAADVDRLVRQLAYAFHAVERPGKERNWSISFSDSEHMLDENGERIVANAVCGATAGVMLHLWMVWLKMKRRLVVARDNCNVVGRWTDAAGQVRQAGIDEL